MSLAAISDPFEELGRREREFLVGRMSALWGGDHLLRGRQPRRGDIQLLSNDYLCLLSEPGLRAAQAQALQAVGTELLMSSIFASGESRMARLERAFAQYLQSEDCIVSQSGWVANIGLLQSIASPAVPVYLDMMAHASLWEGAVAAQARARPFRHNDAAHAERQVGKGGPGILVVDTVYSTNGSLCPLRDFVEVAERTGCLLVVDESHSLGTHGPAGAGLAIALGLADRVHFRTASLAKAFAGRAGLITCSSSFKEYFRIEARPSIFSSGLLDHEYAWFSHALDLIRQADGRRARLHAVSRHVRAALTGQGYDLSAGSEQIIALPSGTEPETMRLRNALQDRGVFGAVFCPPATPKNHCVIRLSMHSGLMDSQVDRLIEGCRDALRAV